MHQGVDYVFSSDLDVEKYFSIFFDNPENLRKDFVSLLERNREIQNISKISIWWDALGVADCSHVVVASKDIKILSDIKEYVLSKNYRIVNSVVDLVNNSFDNPCCNGFVLDVDGELAFSQADALIS